MRALIVTGGLISEKDRSPLGVARKQLAQWRHAEQAWLDFKVKLTAAEPIALAARARRRAAGHPWGAAVERFFAAAHNLDTPELTEAVLATALAQGGVGFDAATYAEAFAAPRQFARKLAGAGLVLASTTLLRDLSEIEAVVPHLKTPHNRVVLGGALTATLARDWNGVPGVDGIAVGYGEYLVPALAEYLRSGFAHLAAPPGGRLARHAHGWVMHSGLPHGKVLDDLPVPDWGLVGRYHGRRHAMIYYESVRGCPYRCNFCNYPYLFDDAVFRYKSARRIADDWQRYRDELGVEYVTCLDSLFTMPRPRLAELCETLMRRNTGIKWICYARADDLAQPGTAAMMREAGCVQAQIGIESGAQRLLDNMNKRCTVEANAAALDACRRAGLTSVVSLIVGFPGETPETLAATYRFLRDAPPDFFFLATFSTRIESVPVLDAAHRARFALRTSGCRRTVAPYWAHATMSCTEVGDQVRDLGRRLMAERVSLNAAVFYPGLLGYDPADRAALLDFQRAAVGAGGPLAWLFDRAHRWVDRRLRADVARALRPEPAPAAPVAIDGAAAAE